MKMKRAIKKVIKEFKKKCDYFEEDAKSLNKVYLFKCCGIEGELWVFENDLEIIATCGKENPYMIIEFEKDILGEVEINIDTYGESQLSERCLEKWNNFVEQVAELLSNAFPDAIVYFTSGVIEEKEFGWIREEDFGKVDRVIVEIGN